MFNWSFLAKLLPSQSALACTAEWDYSVPGIELCIYLLSFQEQQAGPVEQEHVGTIMDGPDSALLELTFIKLCICIVC